MRIAYQYKLKPNKEQTAVIERWLNLLRLQYNYRLAERFKWYEENRCSVNSCSLICHLPFLKERPDYYSQKKDLINTKKLFPEYKEIHSQVLQEVIKKVKITFERWFKGDFNGKRSGKPRFKGIGRYRSFIYPQIKQDCLNGNLIKLPKIGIVKFIKHREIPQGFKIKTVSISKKADGYYVTLSLEDKRVPEINPEINPDKLLGIDMGLKSFLVASNGLEIAIPQYYRHAQKKLRVRQKAVSRKQKGSNNRNKAVKKLALKHLKVANTRKDFHYKTAIQLLKNFDIVSHEKLNIKGLAKTRFSKSINDAGWGQFLTILSNKAEKAGLLTVEVRAYNTTQECSGCGQIVKKTLSQRWHDCPYCDLPKIDRDLNAAINIKNRAEGHPVLKAYRVSDAMAGFGKKLSPSR